MRARLIVVVVVCDFIPLVTLSVADRVNFVFLQILGTTDVLLRVLRSDNSHVCRPGLLVADDDTAWVAVVPCDRWIVPVFPSVKLVQECLLR